MTCPSLFSGEPQEEQNQLQAIRKWQQVNQIARSSVLYVEIT